MCKICGSERSPFVVYSGKVRDGQWGKFVDGRVFECEWCGTRWLEEPKRIDYRHAYRDHVGEPIDEYFRLHDKDQPDRLAFLYEQGISLRDKKVLDVGCGAGSFLDHVEGMAHTAGVEPCASYQIQPRQIYPDLAHVPPASFDIVTAFLVIEHVDDPVQFLEEMKRVLIPGGHIVASTPNADNPIVNFSKGRKFFYRTQHPWYFNAKALLSAAVRAGLKPQCSTRQWRDYDGWEADNNVLPPLRLAPEGSRFSGMYLYMVAQ